MSGQGTGGGGGIIIHNSPTQSGQTTWLGGLVNGIVGVFTHEVWPWFENLFKAIALDNIKVLAPLAEEALQEFLAAAGHEMTHLITGEPVDFLKVFNGTVAGTLQKAEAAALSVTMTDVLAASHAALVNAQQTAAQQAQSPAA